MSKADRLGASPAFGRAGSARSTRGRLAEKALNGNDDGPTRLALHLLSHDPDNPRDSLPDVSDLSASLRDHGQKTAITIMSREAYLAGNPGRENELEPQAAYVVIDGNCRLAAARQAGLSSLRVMLDDSLGSAPDQLLESALVANIHRQDLDPLDEARALETLKQVHGTQEKLAKRLHRSQGWVSQRLALLSLSPTLRKRLEAGEESVELLRAVGKKPLDRQEEELARLKDEQSRKQQAKKTARTKHAPPLAPSEDVHYGVMTEDGAGASTQARQDAPAEPASSVQARTTVPSQAMGASALQQSRADTVPVAWDNPEAVCTLLMNNMAADKLKELVTLLQERAMQ